MLVKDGGTEPIGQRIVEVPVDVEQFEHRDTRSQFIAYVPKGSIAKGEALVKTGGDRASRRLAPPATARTSGASIPFLELPDVRRAISCARSTTSSSTREPEARARLMAPVVEKLSHDDMISLAAYVSSLKP